VALAIDCLKKEKVKRIILTRPAVEAGEELGFLPGDIQAKVSPYLRPLYDAIYDMIPAAEFEKLLEHGRIEMAPLAFMRGRTLNSSFVILDEAQNTTSIQMKMFLTRLGFNSKAVITGDVTQVDLAEGMSGLLAVQDILDGIEGIAFVNLDKADVVRHPLVARIIDAYERKDRRKNGPNSRTNPA
jgi:phosphate starvation-inducible PhoH-like protein